MYYILDTYTQIHTKPLKKVEKTEWNEGKMIKTIISRIKFFKKSGARLYIPQSVLNDPEFPFGDDDLVKIEIGNLGLLLIKPDWWEMLDWEKMKNAFAELPDDIKAKIREKGLGPT